MALKAVLFDFNGVILDDEPIHEELINQVLLTQNIRLFPDDFRQYCLGRSDRAGLRNIISSRGRFISEEYLDQLIEQKAIAYRQKINAMPLPLFDGVQALMASLQSAQVKMAIVSGALHAEISEALSKAHLSQYIEVIIGADDVETSKPHPGGYLKAIETLNQSWPGLSLAPEHCLAIEDTFVGIQAAKDAQIPVVGVAHTYPFHMLQRCVNWTVDHLKELELNRIQSVFNGEPYPTLL